MKKIKSISLMFPLYKDKSTVELMITKSSTVLKKLKSKYEIIIVDDGCPQNSGKLAKKIAKKFSNIKIFFHKKNLGYGAALKTGLKKCKNDWIFMIDGDAEYDVDDLFRLLRVSKNYDLVITYRYKKKYTTYRIIISWVYNVILRLIFNIKFRDISTGSRLVSKKLIQRIKLKSNTNKSKIESGKYYMNKLLPETGSLMSNIMTGAELYNKYDDSYFDLSFKL